MESTVRKIVVVGASGFIGKLLAKNFKRKFDVVLISRDPSFKVKGCKSVCWDAESLGVWVNEFEGAKAIINLSGKSVNCRYTEENRKLIIGSRTSTARLVREAIKECNRPPEVWLNASSATIYEHSLKEKQTENRGVFGEDFSPMVCKRWEEALFCEDLPDTVQVALRMALVLDVSGGVLPEFMKLAKQGLGGRQGNGKQLVSWISSNDLVRSIEFLINEPQQCAINICSPNPLSNNDFMSWVRLVAGVPFGLPILPWMIRVGAYFKGTETELLLKSRFVYPEVLLQAGFEFKNEKLASLRL